MDVKSVFSASVLVFLAIGTSALPVPVPVSYDGLLTLDVIRPDRIVGDFYPQENVPEWYIKFTVVVENEEIVSRLELVLVRENRRVPFTELKIPSENRHHKIVFPNMRGMVLQAAKNAFFNYKANQLPDIRELMDAYDNLANVVHRRLFLYSAEVYQLSSSIIYHSTIVGSVWRLTEGATENDDICRVSLTFANRIRYFVCAQDIQRISTKPENFIDELNDKVNTMDERLSKRSDDSAGSGSGFVPGGGNGGTSGPSKGGGGNGGKRGPSNGGGGNTDRPSTVTTTTSPPTTNPPTKSPPTKSPPTASQATPSTPTEEKSGVSIDVTCKIRLNLGVPIRECVKLVRDVIG